MKALSPRANVRFVPSCDLKLPKEDQSQIVLKPLTVEEEIILDDAVYKTVGNKRVVSMGNKQRMAVHLALVGIENTDIVLVRDKVENEEGIFPLTDECLKSIPKNVRDEISSKVIEMMNPSEEERKN